MASFGCVFAEVVLVGGFYNYTISAWTIHQDQFSIFYDDLNAIRYGMVNYTDYVFVEYEYG